MEALDCHARVSVTVLDQSTVRNSSKATGPRSIPHLVWSTLMPDVRHSASFPDCQICLIKN